MPCIRAICAIRGQKQVRKFEVRSFTHLTTECTERTESEPPILKPFQPQMTQMDTGYYTKTKASGLRVFLSSTRIVSVQSVLSVVKIPTSVFRGFNPVRICVISGQNGSKVR